MFIEYLTVGKEMYKRVLAGKVEVLYHGVRSRNIAKFPKW